ncbi:copper-translocating P-t [Xylariomycetidae sp. FL2044]|nr:copper-translocating P-t [Xylariomycetidae sp. FL2044]
MACSSNCCAPPVSPIRSSQVSHHTPQDNHRQDAQGSCSGPPSEARACNDNPKDDCSAAPASTSKDECKDACCSSPDLRASNECQTTYHGLSSPSDANCRDKCCPPASVKEDPNDPPCCKGKSSPCCDTSCLDRLALRECEGEKSAHAVSAHSCSEETKAGRPCSQHKATIRERYVSRTGAIGCICRALLALGQESCCVSKEPSSVERKRGSRKARVSVESCCASTAIGVNSRGSMESKQNAQSKRNDNKRQASGATGCCGDPKAMSYSAGDYHNNRKQSTMSIATPTSTTHDASIVNDLEKGIVGNEHIILSVSGMTCTGCETKLSRTLGALPSIKNLKTSLILSRAEFDLNIGATSAIEIIQHLERTTEFKCEQVTNNGSSIDVTIQGDAQEFLRQNYPAGVTGMTATGKGVIRIEFDARILGARDLIEKGFGSQSPLELAPLQADPTLKAGSKHVRHVGYSTLLSAILTIPVLVLAWAPLPDHEIAYGSASLALATIIQVVVAGPFYPTSIKSLVFSRVIEMDLLIVLSTTTAYVFSVVAFGYTVSGRPLATGEFFETSTLLVTLIMLGRYVGAFARQRAVESISVRSLQPSVATLVSDDGKDRKIDARLLQYGDHFKIPPDSRVPTDGTVISGVSELDESMLTGEPQPVTKAVKSTLIAGSVNGSGVLVARVTRLPDENTISTIAGMVDEAKLSKPKIQDIADRVASYFVPFVLCITAITFVVWIAIGLAVRSQSPSTAVVNAITFAITVLIVSCPCAIGLAVPMVIVVASGVAADRGVIFKSAESIEVAHEVSHVVFDKTGTLTQGKLAVVEEDFTNGSGHVFSTRLLLGLVDTIKHPVSAAVATYLKSKSVAPVALRDVKALAGKGVEGTSPSGDKVRAGNSRWLNVSSEPRVCAIIEKGYTAFCVTINGSLVGVMGLEDSLRPDASETVAKLQQRGIIVSLLSGDDDGAVCSVARELGIAEPNVRSRCTPGDKQAYIQNLIATPISTEPGKSQKAPVVVFCGDGTNDAAALAQATIGVHVNEGTDVAQSAADVVLVRPNLAGIVTMIDISKAAIHRIRFNFGWGFVYNLFAILLAAGAFVDARIPPQYAGLGELVSVLPVILAAVLLRWEKV